MENLTHTLTGLMMSRAGLRRFHEQAAALLMISANIPDIDAVSWLAGSLNYVHIHRTWTHSLLFLPLVAILPVLLVRLFVRHGFRYWPAYLLSLAGVASHLLIDSTNSYGVRLLHPVSGEWFRLDWNYLYDFAIWGALLVAVVGPWIGKLVSSEMGGKPGTGRGMAIFALLFFCVYDAGRALAHHRALETLESRIYEDGPAVRYAAWPINSNPLFWRGYVETPNALRIYDVDLLGTFDPTGGRVFYKPDSSPALDKARTTDAARTFLDFSQFPLWRVTPAAEIQDGFRVEVMDIRFGLPPQRRFVVTTVLDAALQIKESRFQF